ncbi:unnamed protein product [Microthlaspi erraticum]|uniref:NYN domain-containing protein n=1 Tax=Microthlaspi erraticum TaxID=1685480 RepID=A0A6D2JZ35_9BRAS|nr:unnamed protein product [Microthlaspi erraticum]
MVDFPLDEDKIDSFHRNVQSCLRKEGYIGRVTFTAFGHRVHSSRMMLESVHRDIMLLRLSNRFARLNYMLLTMIDYAAVCPKSNFMLIIKGMAEENVQVVPIIKEIQKKGCNVLLGVSDYDDYFDYPLEVQSSCTIWLWEKLLKGHGPVPFVSDDEDEDDDTSDDEGSSPKHAETVVYWDVEDYPVTDFVSFKEKMRAALVGAGYNGKVSIRAYGEKKPSAAAGITFVYEGSKRGRMHRMLVDMYLRAYDLETTSSAPENSMVITKNMMPAEDEHDTRFVYLLSLLNMRCYNVLVALPDDYKPEQMPFELNFTAWRWSDLLTGGCPLDGSLVERLRDDDRNNARVEPRVPQTQPKSDDIPIDCTCSLCVRSDLS